MARQIDEALLAQLKNPFPIDQVKWRLGATNQEKTKGIALAYIDSRDVQKRLDEVLGISNWRDYLERVDGGFVSGIEIRIGDEWIRRSDAAGDTKVEPLKGGASDAFKRAAAKWGVGRYLYYMPNIWVEIKPVGKSYAIKDKPALPKWAHPQENLESWEKMLESLAEGSVGADDQEVLYTQDQVNEILKDAMADKKAAIRNKLNTEIGGDDENNQTIAE